MSNIKEVPWSEIRAGTRQKGGYMVPGLGEVLVSESDEQKAAQIGANFSVELEEVSPASSSTLQYAIRRFIT